MLEKNLSSRPLWLTFALFGAVCLWASGAVAATYTVTGAGDDLGSVAVCTGSNPSYTCGTLRDALAAAPSGSTVVLPTGPYGFSTVQLNGTLSIPAGISFSSTNVSIQGGTISGTSGLTVSSGSLSLQNSVSYSGGTTVNSASLDLSYASSISVSGNFAVNSGTLYLPDPQAGYTYGAWTIKYGTGSITLNNGTLVLRGTGFDTNHYAYGAGVNSLIANPVILTSAGGTISSSGSAVAISGGVSGSGGLTIGAGSTVILAGNNTYTGVTHVYGALGLQDQLVYSQSTYPYGIPCVYVGSDCGLTSDFCLNSSSCIANINGSLASPVVIVEAGGSFQSSYTWSTTTTFIRPNGTGYVVFNDYTYNYPGLVLYANANGTIQLSSTVQFGAGNNTYAFSEGFAGTGGINKVGSGTVTLGGAGTYSGGTTITAGTLNIAADSSLGAASSALTFAGGTLQFGGATTLASARTITLSGNATIDTNGFADTIASTIAGSGALTKTGAGTLTLTGANTYSGGTTVSAGTLGIGSDAALGASAAGLTLNNSTLQFAAAATLGSGRRLTLNGSDIIDTNGFKDTIASVIAGSGSLTKVGSGTLALTGTNTYTGSTTVSAGTLQISSNVNLGGANTGIVLSNGASLQFGAAATLTSGHGVSVGSGGGVVDTNGFNDTIAGAVSGAGNFTKAGAGTLTLSGVVSTSGALSVNGGTLALIATNTYTGSATANGGTLAVAQNANLGGASTGLILQNGGKLQFTGATTVASSHTITIGSGSGIIDTNGQSDTIAGAINGSGSFLKAGTGTLTLTGAATYAGLTTVQVGTLAIGTGGSLTKTDAIILASGATFNRGSATVTAPVLNANADGSVTLSSALTLGTAGLDFDYGGTFNGAGGLIKTGNGTTTLTGAQSFTGGIQVNGGTLVMNAAGNYSGGVTVRSSGTFIAASDAALGVSNDAVALSGGTFQFGNAFSLTGGHAVTLSSGSTINTGGFADAITSAIGGTGGLTLTGQGSIVLGGKNTYTGGTTINGTTLNVAADSALGDPSSGITFLAGGKLQFGASFNLASTRAITMGAGGGVIDTNGLATTISQAIAGTGSLTKVGAGTLTLTGANTYGAVNTVSTLVNGGVLKVGADAALGQGDVSLSGGTLQSSATYTLGAARHVVLSGSGGTIDTNGFNLTFAGGIQGSGGLIKTGNGTLTLAGSNTYTGGTTLGGGIVNANSDAAFGDPTQNVTFNGGILQLGSSFNLNTARALTLAAAGTIDTNGFNSTISQAISGAGSLTKIGAGTLFLTGQNTYLGTTTVTGGTLNISSDANLGPVQCTGGVGPFGCNFYSEMTVTVNGGTLQAGADLSLGRSVQTGSAGAIIDTNGHSVTIGGNVSGTGALVKNGAGTLTLTAGNYLGNYTGATIVNAGTLMIMADTVLNAPATVTCNGFLGGTPTLGSDGKPSCFFGGLTYGPIAPLTINGATLAFGANLTLYSGRGVLLSQGATIDTGTFAGEIDGVISGSGGLVKAGTGTLTLLGANTYSGGTTVTGGLLMLGSDAALGAAGTGITVSAAGIGATSSFTSARAVSFQGGLTLDAKTNVTLTLSGVLSGTGGLTKIDGGTVALTGANTFAGGIVISGGALSINADAALGNAANVVTINSGGSLNFLASNAIASTRAFVLGGGSINTNGFNETISTVLTGAGGLTKAGNGVLTLTASNTYKGGNFFNGGLVNASSEASLGGAGVALTFNSGGLQFGAAFNPSLSDVIVLNGGGGTLDTNGFDITVANVVSGSGGLTKTGAGTLFLTASNAFTGMTTVAGGTLNIVNNATLASSIIAVGGATLQFGSAFTLTKALQLTGAATLDTGTFNDTLSGVLSGSGGFTKIGGGALTLTAANSYTGGTNLTTGNLVLTGAGSIAGSTSLVDNTVFDFSGITASGTSVQGLAGSGSVLMGSKNLAITGGSGTFSGTISGSGALTVAGGIETLTGSNSYSGGTNFNGGTLNVNSNAALGGAGQNLTFAGGTLQFGAGFNLAATEKVMLNAGGGTFDTNSFNSTLSQNVSGAGMLTKTGAGTLTLAAANTYSGGTTVLGGSLNVSTDAALGAAGTAISLQNGGALQFGASFDLASSRAIALTNGGTIDTNGFNTTLSQAISGGGGLIKIGSGTLFLRGAGTFTDGVTVKSGTLNILSDSAIPVAGSKTVCTGYICFCIFSSCFGYTTVANPDLTLAGGTLQFGAATNYGKILQLGQNGGIVDTNGNTDTISSAIGGSGALTKVGAGTLFLTGVNTYSGGTTVSGGILNVSADSAIGPGADIVTCYTYVLSYCVSSLVTGHNTDLTLDGGTLQFGAAFTYARPFVLTANGGIVDTNGTDPEIDSAISGSGSLTKSGAGTLVLGGTSTYTGGTIVSAGTLQLSATGSLAAGTALTVAGGATFDMNGVAETFGGFTGAGDVLLGNAILTLGTMSANSFSGVISGTGAVVENGSAVLTLSGANTYTGGSTIASGTVRIGADSGLGAATGRLTLGGGTLATTATFSASRNVTLAATSTIDVASATTFTLSGVVSGAGGLKKTDGGTLYLTAANTFTGQTEIVGGTLSNNGTIAGNVLIDAGATLRGTGVVNGTVTNNGGTIAAGNSPGTLTFGGPLDLSGGGALEVDIDGTGTGTGAGNYSRLVLTGPAAALTAGGTINPLLRGITGSASNTFIPVVGQRFNFVQTDAGVIGSFAGIAQPTAGLPGGTQFDAIYYGTNIDLVVTPVSYASLVPLGLADTANSVSLGHSLNAYRLAPGVRMTSERNTVLSALYSLPLAGIKPAMDQIAGTVHGDVIETLRSLSELQSGAIADRLAHGPSAATQTAALTDGVSLWLEGVGAWSAIGSDGNAPGFVSNGGAIVGGIETVPLDGAVLGASVSYAGAHVRTKNTANADVHALRFSAYGAYRINAFGVDAEIGGGTVHESSNRQIVLGSLSRTALGRAGGNNLSATVTAHYSIGRITPFVRAGYTGIDRDAFGETGAGDLDLLVNATRLKTPRVVFGVDIDASAIVSDIGTGSALNVELGFDHGFGRLEGVTGAVLAGVPGTPFVAASSHIMREGVLGKVDFSTVVNDNVALFASYGIEGRGDATTQSANAGIRVSW